MTALAARLALLAIPFTSYLTASPRLTLEQFETPKLLGLFTLAGVLAACGALRNLRSYPALAGWLAAVALAAAMSPSPIPGWLGGEEYQEGVLTCAAYAVLFLAGTTAGAGDRARFRAALLAAAGLAAAYALVQRAGLDPFPGERFRHVRAFAGNPDFLAQQMALALPFALAAALTVRRNAVAAGWIAVTGGLMAVAGLTASRAGSLAAVIGLALTAGAFRHRPGSRARIAAAAAAVVAALLIAEGMLPADLSLGARVRSLAAEGGFRIARGGMWRGTATAIRERPILGWGPDALDSVFLRTAPAGWADDAGLGVTARRAHNDLLHWWSAAGVIGLGMWVWLLVVAWRRDDDPVAGAAIAAALLHNLFSFGTAGTLPVFWVLLGIRSRNADAPTPAFRPGWLPGAAVISAIATIRFAAGAWGYVGNEAERAGRNADAVGAFRIAARLLPVDAAMAARAGRAAETTGAPRDALAWYERAAELSPIDGLILGHVGRVRGAIARAAHDRTEEAAAHAILLRAVELAPSQPSLWGAAIMSAQSLGRRDEIPGLIAGMQRAAPGWAAKLLAAPPPQKP